MVISPPAKYFRSKPGDLKLRGCFIFCTAECLGLGEPHLHGQKPERLMKAEMSQGRHAAQGEIDGLGRVAAAGSLTQAATANCVSNNADPVGRRDAWQKSVA